MMNMVEEITALALVIAEQRAAIAELQMRLAEYENPENQVDPERASQMDALTTRNVELLAQIVELEKKMAGNNGSHV